MILTGVEIKKAVVNGEIVLSPFDESCINPNSYNYHLGSELRVCTNSSPICLRNENSWSSITIHEEGILLQPRTLYLASTREKIGSNQHVVTLIGRSSMGRRGLFVQVSAELGNIGASHCWTLEIYVVQPLRIYAGLQIGQVCFWRAKGDKVLYSGVYSNYDEPKASILQRLML